MTTLPPVADPTAPAQPRSTGVIVAPAPAVAPPPALTSTSVAPAPPRAPVLAKGVARPATALGVQTSTSAPMKASAKSKKKSASVTMATAATAQSTGQTGSSGENTGRWTAEEHNLFLQGLELHGKGWKKIAGLIKSRTVVQIRTHAQKYFQKLAKAKQNGEDVTLAGGGVSNGGAVAGSTITMMMGEGRSALGGGGAVANAAGTVLSSSSAAGSGHATAHSNKRRKQTSGTKRKAIQSVVASARRESKKKLAAASTARTSSTSYEQSTNRTAPLGTLNPIMDSVAPVLAPYVLPTPLSSMTAQQPTPAGASATAQGVIGVTALEDSLFRYLSPVPILPPETQVNPVARQAGANPITLPTDQTIVSSTLACGEVSPTGVDDLDLCPTWTDYNKEAPSWYSKGSDVDALLDVADTLDWLADTGDLAEAYEEAERMHSVENVDPSQPSNFQLTDCRPQKDDPPIAGGSFYSSTNNTTSMSMNTLPRIDSGTEVNVPPLPSLFEGDDPTIGKNKLDLHLSTVPSVTNLDEHLFSSPMEEHDFVSTILDETGVGSSATLAALDAIP